MKKFTQADIEHEAVVFAKSLRPAEGATVVTLSGDLGAGKTTFVKALAKAFGVKEHVTSPTFVIMKIYELEAQTFARLVHMDAYRLKGVHHLKVLGWDGLVRDSKNLICVEWPEKIEDAIPAEAKKITLRYSDDALRHIIYG